VLGLGPSAGPITRGDVERMIDARLLAGEARRLDLAPEAEALAAAWAAAADRAGGPAALEAWLDAQGVDRDWARALVEQDVLGRRFVDQRFRAFVFVGEDDVDAALGAAGGSPEAREAARRRLTDDAVARGVAEWLRDARARARWRIFLVPGRTAPLVLPMPAGPALRGGTFRRMVTAGHRGPFSGREAPAHDDRAAVHPR
jgi:hypothetical protein